MVFGTIWRKATKFLGKAHSKARHLVGKAKEGMEKVRSWGTKASQFLDNMGAGGRAIKRLAEAGLEKPIVGGMGAREIFEKAEKATALTDRALRGDKALVADLAKEGLQRYGGDRGRYVAQMIY
jgi:hypothetical protein